MIGVFAPSSYIEREDIEASIAIAQDRGLGVFVHPQSYARHGQSAGTREDKLDALHALYRNPDISVIWAAGGGNRALHILDGIDYDLIHANPKPIVGFSDVTALLNMITAHADTMNYHAPVFKNLHRTDSSMIEQTFDLLKGNAASYPMDDVTALNEGRAEGILCGGNLSVFQYLPQSMPQGFCDDVILFLEDCNEELSRIDRMLLHLRRLGVFKRAAGIIFGQFTDLQDSARPFGFSLEDILREHTDGLDIPVVMNAPFGHGRQLYALPIGGRATLEISRQRSSLSL